MRFLDVSKEDTSKTKINAVALTIRQFSLRLRRIILRFSLMQCSLACRCAEETRKRGFTHFGLQNFGECWSGSDAEKKYDKDGPSKECLMVAQNPPPPCDIDDPRDCAGYPNVNYVYRLGE